MTAYHARVLPTSSRPRRPRRPWPMLAVLALVAVPLSGCVTSEAPVNQAAATAGEGSCELPTIQLDPASTSRGGEVTVRGTWFVEGCGGDPGLDPLTLIPVSFTDAQGVNFGLAPIDAQGDDGTIDAVVDIPADVATGTGRLTVGQAAPATLDVQG